MLKYLKKAYTMSIVNWLGKEFKSWPENDNSFPKLLRSISNKVDELRELREILEKAWKEIKESIYELLGIWISVEFINYDTIINFLNKKLDNEITIPSKNDLINLLNNNSIEYESIEKVYIWKWKIILIYSKKNERGLYYSLITYNKTNDELKVKETNTLASYLKKLKKKIKEKIEKEKQEKSAERFLWKLVWTTTNPLNKSDYLRFKKLFKKFSLYWELPDWDKAVNQALEDRNMNRQWIDKNKVKLILKFGESDFEIDIKEYRNHPKYKCC